MPISGPLAHIDLSVSDPAEAVAFYATLLQGLGFARVDVPYPEYQGDAPTRAQWRLAPDNGLAFEIDLRPSEGPDAKRVYDRYAPGPHHIAFHAESRAAVDTIHAAIVAAGAIILDPPADYTGQTGYEDGYYAAFFADPDGLKWEVVHLPGDNTQVPTSSRA